MAKNKGAFRVEVSEKPCKCCGRGGLWDVVGPNGVATGIRYGDKEEAKEQAKELSYAYSLGVIVFSRKTKGGK